MTVAEDRGVDAQPICYINGRRVTLPPGRGEATLLQFLRERGLTGTKLGCGEGGCGACTIMLSHSENGEVYHRAVNACLCPLYAVEGMHVVTVEGIGNTRQGLHPVQERLASSHGSQCGFCTPGFVMSMYALLRTKADAPPNEEEIEDALGGNLCRCTGYRPILDAFKTFAKSDPRAYTEEAIAAGRGVKPSYAADTDVTLLGPTGNGGTHATSNVAVDSHALQVVPDSKTTANGNVTPNGKGGAICPSSGMPCDCGAAAAPPASQQVKCVANGDGGCGVNGGGCGANNKGGASCACKANGGCCAAANGNGLTNGKQAAATVRATVEPIFPPELKTRATQYLKMPGEFVNWHRPATLQQLLELKKEFPAARLVVGSTEVGIEMKFKAVACPVIIAPTHVPELIAINVTDKGVSVGAAASLSRLLAVFKQQVAERPAHETSTFTAVINQLRWFAGTQIRNVSSLGGNICTGSPISDLNPLWMASGTTFTLMGLDTGKREVPANKFFLGYRQVDIQPHEVLYSVNVPFTRPYEYVKEFKQSPRREDDIAIVNAGMRVLMGKNEEGAWVFQEAEVAYGGVAAKAIMAQKLAAALVGQPLDEATLQAAIVAVRGDVSVSAGAPGGRSEYRNSLAASFVFKYFIFVANMLEKDEQSGFKTPFPADYASAGKVFERHPAHGVQFYAEGPVNDVVGQPAMHMAANLQVCGEATYTDDIKLSADALIAAVVTSTRPHARLTRVDATAALAMPGVVGFYSAKDVPGDNAIGPVMPDEEVYASEFVTAVGQVIGVVVAETEDQARRAARAVVVEYEDLPAVMSCEEAVEAGQAYKYIGKIDCGDVDQAFASSPAHVLEGTFKVGGQEHFYLETNACCVIPLENEEYVMYSSTQAPAKHQKSVAHVLHVPAHKIVSKTKRLGGGFGGKETRGIFLHCAIAVPAYHLQRPVKIQLDRDEDMQMTGHRHAFMCKYKVACDAEGKIVAVDLNLFSNVGNSYDLSTSIMDRALMHSDNTYKVPNMRIRGTLCKTNQSSNTAFRGFGGPQGLMFCEMWMDQIARTVGKHPAVVRELNMYHEGDTTPFTQVLTDCRARPCWDTVMAQAGFLDRVAAAAEFNKQNRWRKRGLAATPTKFGISFTTKFLNQAGALVHAYLDGTVLVTHGGVEMGQGLHTKMAQVAAQALGVPLSQVFISETATDKVPNASPTAASASSDMYGGAVLDACKQIADRLAPYREKAPQAKFKELVNAAYLERVDLSAHGFYKTPDITGFGGVRPFNYLCYGAAVSEVELDTLTGDWHLLRTDIVMDVGNPLNPAIDIGQVEGGFVQGMGWTCIEELQWGDKQHQWVRPGHLFTKGPGTYKIPSVNDIPIDFRVTLLRDAPNDRAIHSSKAVGEPPLFLGASVFFALKEAVYAAREAAGHPGYFVMDAPATPERLRMLCADEITAPMADAQIRPLISC